MIAFGKGFDRLSLSAASLSAVTEALTLSLSKGVSTRATKGWRS